MAYKFKPSKSVAKRFRVTKTGKLKHSHTMNSHLRSVRTGSLKRRLGRPAVLSESLARGMRKFMGLSRLKPAKIAAEREIAANAQPVTE